MRRLGERVRGPELAGDALDVARLLLGCELRRDGVMVRITEVEAYRGPGDSACHTRVGRTPRNAPMWGPPGRAYVYLCYGVHSLLNVVCGDGAAVLLRAAEPLRGQAEVASRRGAHGGPPLAGPGRLARGLGLDVTWSGHDLCAPGGLELWWGPAPEVVVAGPRVGIDYARPEHRDAPWRLADGRSRHVSRRRALVTTVTGDGTARGAAAE